MRSAIICKALRDESLRPVLLLRCQCWSGWLCWHSGKSGWRAPIFQFVLPPPSAIGAALIDHFGQLTASLLVTLEITLLAFFWAIVSGIELAVLFTRSQLIERSFTPMR